jgi:glycosyltransferase involved in cell wall biosynthesis
MSKLKRVAFIGNSLPRRCGIATFTTDLQQAVAGSRPHLDTSIVAMTDRGQAYAYPMTVRIEIKDDRPEDYVAAADALNRAHVDVVSLQHEFGIFGGAAGIDILALLSRLTMPVVTTLHTVLAEPTPVQRRVFERIIEASSRLVVMAEKGRDMLQGIYGVPAHKIEVVAHGIPDAPFEGSEPAKRRMGYGGRPVMLTFGLLSPNKGIEVVIDAMPMILEGSPNAVYVVLGATHPHLVRDQGEAYRESLVARVRRARHRGSRRLPRPVRRPGNAAGPHFDVRRLRHALSRRGADDVGDAGLQFRIGPGDRFHPLLARLRTVG